jgi:hypothetical protein
LRLELVASRMPPGSDVWPRTASGTLPIDRARTERAADLGHRWHTVRRSGQGHDASGATGGWTLGPPTEVLPMPSVGLDSNEAARVVETILPLGPRPRALVAVDFRPGTPAIVRSARLIVREHEGGAARDTPVGLWVPGDEAAPLPDRAAWHVTPGAELVVRTAYRKRWDRERQAASDQSAVACTRTRARRCAGRRARCAGHRPGHDRAPGRGGRACDATPHACWLCGLTRPWRAPPFVWTWSRPTARVRCWLPLPPGRAGNGASGWSPPNGCVRGAGRGVRDVGVASRRAPTGCQAVGSGYRRGTTRRVIRRSSSAEPSDSDRTRPASSASPRRSPA